MGNITNRASYGLDHATMRDVDNLGTASKLGSQGVEGSMGAGSAPMGMPATQAPIERSSPVKVAVPPTTVTSDGLQAPSESTKTPGYLGAAASPQSKHPKQAPSVGQVIQNVADGFNNNILAPLVHGSGSVAKSAVHGLLSGMDGTGQRMKDATGN